MRNRNPKEMVFARTDLPASPWSRQAWLPLPVGDQEADARPGRDGETAVAQEAGQHMEGQPVALQGGHQRPDRRCSKVLAWARDKGGQRAAAGASQGIGLRIRRSR